MNEQFLEIEDKIVTLLKEVYDPEIPVNIYDLGLIYEINVSEKKDIKILMTLTSPTCPVAGEIVEEINTKVKSIDGINEIEVKLTFEPTWTKDMMSEEAKLELGFL